MSRHPSSERFHALLREAGEMHDRKQKDYGTDVDPFANVRASTEWGLPAWVGAGIRMNDKMRRLQSFVKNGRLENESITDTFMDLAVYALIGLALYEEEAGQNVVPNDPTSEGANAASRADLDIPYEDLPKCCMDGEPQDVGCCYIGHDEA